MICFKRPGNGIPSLNTELVIGKRPKLILNRIGHQIRTIVLKILFFTGSRSEYGIIRPLLMALDNVDSIHYKLIVTGSHL